MKIGINASFLRKPHVGIGQVTRHALDALFALPEAQQHTFILYLPEQPTERFSFPSFVTQKVVPSLYKRDDMVRKIIWEMHTFPHVTQRDACDAVLSMYQSPSVVPSGSVKQHHVMIVHDVIPKFFPDYLNSATKKVDWHFTERGIRAADDIVTVSFHTKMDLEERMQIPAKTITASHISCDPRFYQAPSNEEKQRVLKKYSLPSTYIYTGGGLEKRKNVESTIRAYATLVRQCSGEENTIPTLVISGKLLPQLAPLITDVEKLVQELGMENCVKILGFVPQEDLPALYANALFFVYPSLYEGFGLPVLESMYCGTPVLTTKRSSIPEVGGDAVWYATEGTVEEIFDGMKELVENEGLRSDLARRGLERSVQFTWSSFAQELYAHLNKATTSET